MTATTHPLGAASGASSGSPEGALVRLTADDQRLAQVPPAPAGDQVTVSLSTVAADQRYAGGLERQGYRLVAVCPEPAGASSPAHVDFLVPAGLVENHPRWWRALVADADAVFSLSHGPVQRVLADVLGPHLAARP